MENKNLEILERQLNQLGEEVQKTFVNIIEKGKELKESLVEKENNDEETAIPRYVDTEDLMVDGPFNEDTTEIPAEYVPHDEFNDMVTLEEEFNDESIKQKCEELEMEVDDEMNNIVGIVCYVGDLTEQLIHGYNCNIKEFRLFNKYLITNLGMEIHEFMITPEMESEDDIIVIFSIDGMEFSHKVSDLMNVGLATWIQSISHPVEMSGLEYRAITKLCTANELLIRVED